MTDGVRQWRPSRTERKLSLATGLFGLAYAIFAAGSTYARIVGVPLGCVSILIGAWFLYMSVTYGVRNRVVLTAETLTVVFGLRTRWFLVSQVASVRSGPWGIEFLMNDGQKVRSGLAGVKRQQLKSQRPSAKRQLELTREITNAVLTTAVRARAQHSNVTRPADGVRHQSSDHSR